ncbi:MAG: hypothetical protein K6G13_03075 [Agathobacter sp.]|uniref:hypothetical protein n=1 Tax=Agathobacter sp. TaxID=2021311 RepID=UPI0025901DE6|nr:hypothetical protein [Agathobacter sp.]MCR5676998.1 hypothetical protein [Agathobacter sp.]
MKLCKNVLGVVLVAVLCIGCSNSNEAKTDCVDSYAINWISTDSKIDATPVVYDSYQRNEDGTWESGGQVYQYCIEMVKEDSVDGKDYFTKRIVLSNLEELDPQKVDSLEPYSDKYPAEYDSSEALLVEEISWSGEK